MGDELCTDAKACGNHHRAVRTLPDVADAEELVGSAGPGARQVNPRVGIDRPQTRIAPKRSQRFDDSDTGAVSLNDQGRNRVRDRARDETGQQEKHYEMESRSGSRQRTPHDCWWTVSGRVC